MRNTCINIMLALLWAAVAIGCATTVKDLSPTARVYAMAKDYEVYQDLTLEYLRLPACGTDGHVGACRTQAVATQLGALDQEVRASLKLARQVALSSEEACEAPENETEEERQAREATCDSALVLAAQAASAARLLLNRLVVLLLQPEAKSEVTDGYQTTYLKRDGDRPSDHRWASLADRSGASRTGQVPGKSSVAREAGPRAAWADAGRVGGGREPPRREGGPHRGAVQGTALLRVVG